MIVQIKYKGIDGTSNIIHDVECSDEDTCPTSGQPLPINNDAKWERIFDKIADLGKFYEIVV